MKSLPNVQQKSYENTNICYICKVNLKMNMLKTENILTLEIIVIIQVNIEVLCIAYVIQSIVCLKGFLSMTIIL